MLEGPVDLFPTFVLLEDEETLRDCSAIQKMSSKSQLAVATMTNASVSRLGQPSSFCLEQRGFCSATQAWRDLVHVAAGGSKKKTLLKIQTPCHPATQE